MCQIRKDGVSAWRCQRAEGRKEEKQGGEAIERLLPGADTYLCLYVLHVLVSTGFVSVFFLLYLCIYPFSSSSLCRNLCSASLPLSCTCIAFLIALSSIPSRPKVHAKYQEILIAASCLRPLPISLSLQRKSASNTETLPSLYTKVQTAGPALPVGSGVVFSERIILL